jgi:hypothetical protein
MQFLAKDALPPMTLRKIALILTFCTFIGHDLALAGSATTVPVTSKKVAQPAAKKDQPNGYSLIVRHRMIGRTEWLASQDGAKMLSPLFSMTMSAATGAIYLFNPEEKTYTEFKNPAVLKKKLQTYGAMPFDKYKWTPWKIIKKETIKTVDATTYSRILIDPPSDKNRHLTSTYEEQVTLGRMPKFKFLDHFSDVVAGLLSHNAPATGIVVGRKTIWKIYRWGKLEKDDTRNELELVDSTRVPLKKEDFTVPKNYKRCASETEIMPEGMAFGLH